uniref:7TM_GPCR_Srx domain-containing protein n=1 Tax=Caenorhabditis tropicalis TaxID=1561998 RepID=A0A1I7TYE3_9PELO
MLPLYTILIVLNSSIWGLGTYIFNSPTPENDLELSIEFLKSYCLRPEEYGYTGAKYFRINEQNEREYHLNPFISTFLFALSQTGTLSMAGYFGIQTYNSLNKLEFRSNQYRDIQNQLFRTLVIQTFIPFCFMHFPVGCLFVFL